MNERFDPLVEEWKNFANHPAYNLAEKCFKLAQILEYPNLVISHYLEKLVSLGKTLNLEVDKQKSVTYKISMLNEFLFARCGFRGDTEDYYNPKNNFLNEVLEKRTGIPITLSIIYSQVAKHLGLDIKIVGFPAHVVVKVDEQTILDPFNNGRLLSIDDLREILNRSYGGQVEFLPQYLDEIGNEKILIRLIRNLKNSYVQSYAYERAMRCTNMILALEPDSPEDIRDKGILEDRLLNYNSALKLLNRYLELSPDAQDADLVLELIRGIRSKI